MAETLSQFWNGTGFLIFAQLLYNNLGYYAPRPSSRACTSSGSSMRWVIGDTCNELGNGLFPSLHAE